MKIINFFMICLMLLLVSGCGSTKLGTSSLIPDTVVQFNQVTESSLGSVTVDSNIKSQMILIDEEDFGVGLSNALNAAGLFGNGSDKYSIHAVMIALDYPSVSIDFDTFFTVQYTIYAPDGSVMTEETVKSHGKSNGMEHFVGAHRLKAAIDRSAQDQYYKFVSMVHDAIKQKGDL